MTTAKISLKWRVLIHLLLLSGVAIMVLPFYWMVSTSFKTLTDSMMTPPTWFPHPFDFEWYGQVVNQIPFLQYYWNTILMTVGRTCGQLLFCSMAAYGFARLRFPGKNICFVGMLAVLMVPYQVVLIPQYIEMKDFGWINTFLALIIPGMFSAYGTFLLRQFFMTLPRDLEDAGKIDGLSYLGVYLRVALPLCRPALVTLGFFTILWSWNDFLWPLIITSTDSMKVLTTGINSLQSIYFTSYPLLMAGAVLATIPMVLLFIFIQRYVIEGIALTGIKG